LPCWGYYLINGIHLREFTAEAQRKRRRDSYRKKRREFTAEAQRKRRRDSYWKKRREFAASS
jgi:hypothetical protein